MTTRAIAALWLLGGTAPAPQTATVNPQVIEIGMFYAGAKVRVEGVAAPGSRVIVTIKGSDREEEFNRKARFGPVWVSAGKVRISGAPSLFLSFSAEPAETLLDPAELNARALDENSVARRLRLHPPQPDAESDAAIRSSYLALKRSDGLYAAAGNRMAISVNPDGTNSYRLEFQWPKKAPPARYEARVYEVRGGAVARETCLPLTVVKTGFPAWLSGLAQERAPLYGIVAVVAGALAGFGIDLLTNRIFGRKRAAFH